MNKRGVTVIELLIVLVIMGIIATFVIVNVTTLQSQSRIEADTNTVIMLNQVTQDYSMISDSHSVDIFAGIDDDEECLQKLVDEKFLSRVPTPSQKGATFVWNHDEGYWTLEGGELSGFTGSNSSGTDFDFAVDMKEYLTENGVVFRNESNWVEGEGYLENKSGEQRMFVPTGKSSYTITVSASLSSGSGGGYGIFFDTILENGNENRDSGLIFQFDRGYSQGAMIVRPRTNGRESGPVWTLHASTSDVFPSKTEDPDWWTNTHTIKIKVSSDGGTNRTATFYIDGTDIGSYSYTKDVSEQVLYTGFRTWSSPTTKFYSLNVN